MKNILITGASGFIGSFLVEEALKEAIELLLVLGLQVVRDT
jgi:nucleoside-diphosphate-sugar epimerase